MTSLVHRGTWPGLPAAAVLTLDSPANRNALSRALVADLSRELATTTEDDSIRVVVLAGAGPAFCAGADLAQAAAGGMHEGATLLVDLLRTVVALPKPVVAVIEGPARGGGLGLVAACDVAICLDSVTFAFPEARLSLAPAVISLTVLPRLSPRAASWAMLSGETFDAHRAAEVGLVTRAVPAAELHDVVDDMLRAICAATPQGLAATKRLLVAPVLARIEAHGQELAHISAELFASDAAQQAMQHRLRPRAARLVQPRPVVQPSPASH